ncbi:MAG: hypothetical protein EKK41_00150 [Hyphomicrobiales bacterium]|nr:MAG: hypothetical protein EKK41_00150 [Hyphomicrobiales bacterium]
MPETITKIEAARRQLVTAIRLFFEDADSVSVYALAHAAWEVLDALCTHRDKTRFREEMTRATGLSEAEIKKIANYGRNFFKHADRKPDDALENFSDDLNDHVLMAACFDYGELADSKPMEMQVFQIWYFAAHPDKALRPEMDQIIDAGQRLFSNLSNADRKSRKQAGLRVAIAARRDPKFMLDTSTDRRSVAAIG